MLLADQQLTSARATCGRSRPASAPKSAPAEGNPRSRRLVPKLGFMAKSGSGIGLVPEQVWEDPNLAASPYGSDPTAAPSIGFVNGSRPPAPRHRLPA